MISDHMNNITAVKITYTMVKRKLSTYLYVCGHFFMQKDCCYIHRASGSTASRSILGPPLPC